MKIVHISDTHGLHTEVNVDNIEADMVVHSGDFLTDNRDSLFKVDEFNAFIEWFASLPFKHKVLVAGNHDWYCFDCYRDQIDIKQSLLENFGIHYLMDEAVTIEGIRFYGSPWQPEFMNWAFNLPGNGTELQQKWQAIPTDTDVLITHGPAFGYLDVGSPQMRSLGCELLRQRLDDLPKLRLHLFGHIHEDFGMKKTERVHFYNSSYLNPAARFGNYPPVIDLNSI